LLNGLLLHCGLLERFSSLIRYLRSVSEYNRWVRGGREDMLPISGQG
jgi:hypothetical protein